jgi:hypothetical protein
LFPCICHRPKFGRGSKAVINLGAVILIEML